MLVVEKLCYDFICIYLSNELLLSVQVTPDN